MTAETKIRSRNALGVVDTVEIKNHPTIHSVDLTASTGEGDPDWVKKQGIPKIIFIGESAGDYQKTLLNFEALRTKLGENGIPVSGGTIHIVLDNPKDLKRALETIGGFDAETISKLDKMREESETKHTAYLSKLTDRDITNIQEAKRLSTALSAPDPHTTTLSDMSKLIQICKAYSLGETSMAKIESAPLRLLNMNEGPHIPDMLISAVANLGQGKSR